MSNSFQNQKTSRMCSKVLALSKREDYHFLVVEQRKLSFNRRQYDLDGAREHGEAFLT